MNKKGVDKDHMGTPRTIEVSSLLSRFFEDNKKIAKEFELQLAVVEKLQKENNSLSSALEKARRDGMLNHNRDELNMKRNVSLIRENRFLRERLEVISMEKEKVISEFSGSRARMQDDFNRERENLRWRRDKLEIELATVGAKVKAMEKACEHLREKLRKV
jgi:hypothetical protein